MKRLIIPVLLCFVLAFSVACNGDDGVSVVPPNRNEQTQTGGEDTEENGGAQAPEQEENDNKGKPVTPIQNGGTITTK